MKLYSRDILIKYWIDCKNSTLYLPSENDSDRREINNPTTVAAVVPLSEPLAGWT